MLVAVMISMLTYRTPDQRATTVVNCWWVGHGTQELARVCWDPQGPMTAVEAARAALERAYRAISRPGPLGAVSGQDTGADGGRPYDRV